MITSKQYDIYRDLIKFSDINLKYVYVPSTWEGKVLEIAEKLESSNALFCLKCYVICCNSIEKNYNFQSFLKKLSRQQEIAIRNFLQQHREFNYDPQIVLFMNILFKYNGKFKIDPVIYSLIGDYENSFFLEDIYGVSEFNAISKILDKLHGNTELYDKIRNLKECIKSMNCWYKPLFICKEGFKNNLENIQFTKEEWLQLSQMLDNKETRFIFNRRDTIRNRCDLKQEDFEYYHREYCDFQPEFKEIPDQLILNLRAKLNDVISSNCSPLLKKTRKELILANFAKVIKYYCKQYEHNNVIGRLGCEYSNFLSDAIAKMENDTLELSEIKNTILALNFATIHDNYNFLDDFGEYDFCEFSEDIDMCSDLIVKPNTNQPLWETALLQKRDNLPERDKIVIMKIFIYLYKSIAIEDHDIEKFLGIKLSVFSIISEVDNYIYDSRLTFIAGLFASSLNYKINSYTHTVLLDYENNLILNKGRKPDQDLLKRNVKSFNSKYSECQPKLIYDKNLMYNKPRAFIDIIEGQYSNKLLEGFWYFFDIWYKVLSSHRKKNHLQNVLHDDKLPRFTKLKSTLLKFRHDYENHLQLETKSDPLVDLYQISTLHLYDMDRLQSYASGLVSTRSQELRRQLDKSKNDRVMPEEKCNDTLEKEALFYQNIGKRLQKVEELVSNCTRMLPIVINGTVQESVPPPLKIGNNLYKK